MYLTRAGLCPGKGTVKTPLCTPPATPVHTSCPTRLDSTCYGREGTEQGRIPSPNIRLFLSAQKSLLLFPATLQFVNNIEQRDANTRAAKGSLEQLCAPGRRLPIGKKGRRRCGKFMVGIRRQPHPAPLCLPAQPGSSPSEMPEDALGGLCPCPFFTSPAGPHLGVHTHTCAHVCVCTRTPAP